MHSFSNKKIPVPSVMPIDREKWQKRIGRSNFINCSYQFRDIQRLEDIKSILIIGPGQGLSTEVFKWRGYQVTTLDIDETFKPDHIGSVHEMPFFADKQFDAVIASHVLEHLPVAYLDKTLRELSRVSHYCLIYLPVAGRHFQIRFEPGFGGIDKCLILDIFNWFKKTDGNSADFCQGQHFWELGRRGFRTRNFIKMSKEYFDLISVYRNHDWNPSKNFIFKSRELK